MGAYRVRPGFWVLAAGLAASAGVLFFGWPQALQARTFTEVTQEHRVRGVIVSDALDSPWGLAFLPDGGPMLVTEKGGTLRTVSFDGQTSAPLAGLPEITPYGQGGLLDVVLDPEFTTNRLIYLSYAKPVEGGRSTAILRARLSEDLGRVTEAQDIFVGVGPTDSGAHFGGRMVFDAQGHLYLTIGDRGQRDTVQIGRYHRGVVLRMTRDGEPVASNPFPPRPGHSLRHVFTTGHRNPQGMSVHPQTGDVWTSEHGPQGGDEINRLVAGTNYGWAAVTYGENYGGGRFAPTSLPQYAEPDYYYVPSIAPSGMAFYDGDKFPDWQGDLFLGALKLTHLNRLEMDGDQVVGEERLLQGFDRRIRDVRSGPQGYLWLLTDDGLLVRLEPAD